jgi:dTDP-4-dehydrorhamnose 3,5-epimerase
MSDKPAKLDGVFYIRGTEAIEGVQVLPLRRIPDERGTIFHMMRSTDAHFKSFGEIYFSTISQGIIKGWHKHREMSLNYACPVGRIKCVLYDDRPGSKTQGNLMEVYLGPDSYNLLIVPPDVWNGFKGVTDAMVANCCTHSHDPSRSSRLDPFDPGIGYDWAARNH